MATEHQRTAEGEGEVIKVRAVKSGDTVTPWCKYRHWDVQIILVLVQRHRTNSCTALRPSS